MDEETVRLVGDHHAMAFVVEFRPNTVYYTREFFDENNMVSVIDTSLFERNFDMKEFHEYIGVWCTAEGLQQVKSSREVNRVVPWEYFNERYIDAE